MSEDKKKDKNSPLENLKDEKNEDVSKKLEQLKGKIEKLKKGLIKKFNKHVVGIALVPPPKDEKNKNRISVLIVMNDDDSKKIPKEELKKRLLSSCDKIALEIDKDMLPELLLTSEMQQNCYDGKYEFLELLAMAAPFYDPTDIIKGLKVSAIHKKMVLKKFEKYILSYVAAGSLFRGEKKANDIDVWIVIDDTDVKKMPRLELKEKLRTIITSQGFEANAIAQTNKKFHVQVYILTDFWEGIKDANPVYFTLLRDGTPLYDRGVFMPWKLLLEMGRIKPSPEAIDMFMSSGEKILEKVKFRLRDILELDIYWSVITPSQAALMLYGLPPPTPKETVSLMEDIFVKKEKWLEKKYVVMLEEIRKTYKDLEHGKLKEVSGSDVDRLLKNSNDYLKRIRKLFDQIEKDREKDSVIEIYNSSKIIIEDVLKLNDVKGNLESGLKTLVDNGEIPLRYLKVFKEIEKAKKEYEKDKLSKHEIIKVNKDGRLFIRELSDYMQRKRGSSLNRATIKVKYDDKFGDVVVLENKVFVIKDASKKSDIREYKLKANGEFGESKKSSVEEMEDEINKKKIPRNIMIKEKTFESLKNVFGNKVEVVY